VACLLGLVLGSVGSGEQGKIEGTPADVPAVHVQRAEGVAGGVGSLVEVAETLGHAGGQVGLVEVGQPCRVVFAGGAVECPLRSGKCGSAVVGVIARCVAVRLHNQAFGE
jgi:hypothetical protein